jgi:hypothetical protein
MMSRAETAPFLRGSRESTRTSVCPNGKWKNISPSLAPAEAGESISGTPASAAAGTRADEPRKRAHQPRIDGDALPRGGRFDRGLQTLGKAKRDARDENLVAHGRGRGFALVLHVDERRILPGQADLNMSCRKLVRKLERGFAQGIEQAQARRGPDGRDQPASGFGGGIVADGGDTFEIGLQAFDERA